MTRQTPRRGISKEILDMITHSIGRPPTRYPDSPPPAAQDATRIVPKRSFVDDTPPMHLDMPRDVTMREREQGDIERARDDEHSEWDHLDAIRRRLSSLRTGRR